MKTNHDDVGGLIKTRKTKLRRPQDEGKSKGFDRQQIRNTKRGTL